MAATRTTVCATLVAIAASACSSSSSTSGGPRVSSTVTASTTSTAPPRANGPSIIIDTDFSRWWDDVTVIGMANVLVNQRRLNVLGIMSDIRNPVAVAAIDAIDTAYGNGRIPLGAVAHSDANTSKHGYSDLVAQRLPHRINSSADVPDAVALYRTLLTAQPDHSVTIVAIGAYTNLAGLLASPGGPALITRKVKRLVIEDGLFPGGVGPATNQALDLAAARTVVAGTPRVAPWPTPIAWVDGADGIATRVGSTLCKKVPADNPMRIVYEDLFRGCGAPRDGDWDGPTLLFAIGDVPDVFREQGRGGAAVFNKQGGLAWRSPSARPDDYYVHLANQAALNHRIDALLTVAA